MCHVSLFWWQNTVVRLGDAKQHQSQPVSFADQAEKRYNSNLTICLPTCNAQSWWSSGRTVGQLNQIIENSGNPPPLTKPENYLFGG